MKYMGTGETSEDLHFEPEPIEKLLLARVAGDILAEDCLNRSNNGDGATIEAYQSDLLEIFLSWADNNHKTAVEMSLIHAKYLSEILQSVQLGDRPVGNMELSLAQTTARDAAYII